jgi:hypothetical protein
MVPSHATCSTINIFNHIQNIPFKASSCNNTRIADKKKRKEGNDADGIPSFAMSTTVGSTRSTRRQEERWNGSD